MDVFNEGRHPGEGLMSEAPGVGARSREVVTIKSGAGVIAPGTVLGEITSDGKFIPSPHAEVTGSEGAEVATAISLYGCDATSSDQQITVIARAAVWNGNTLTYDSSVDNGAKRTTKQEQLADQGIIIRN